MTLLGRLQEPRHCEKAISQFFPLSTELRWAAGLRDVFWRSHEETLDTAPEIEQSPGKDRANPLKHQESGARINICMGLALKGKAERNKKQERYGEISQVAGHSCSLGEYCLRGQPYLEWRRQFLEKVSSEGPIIDDLVICLTLGCPLREKRCLASPQRPQPLQTADFSTRFDHVPYRNRTKFL
jgi:hypothetical protein